MSRATSGSSSASLHYGILVNMHRLTRAATAFSNFSTDVLSLDLVLSRRQRSVPIRSTLSPAPHVSLQELPIEILLTIREHLFEIHRKETPNEFFAEHRAFSVCDCCDHHFDRPSDPAKWDRWDWEDHESWGCDICAELTEDPTAEAVEPIRRLLRAYGLALPSSTPVDTQNTKRHTATFYDPSFFKITPHDNRKFSRFLRDLRLSASAHSTGGGAIVSSPSFVPPEKAVETKIKEKAKGGKKAATVNKAAVQPAFMLLHSMVAMDP